MWITCRALHNWKSTLRILSYEVIFALFPVRTKGCLLIARTQQQNSEICKTIVFYS